MLSPARSAWCTKKLNSTGTLIQRTTTEAPQGHMYYIGLDVHKKTISYCVKDASGQVHQEGQIGATRWELDGWMKTLPQPWTVAMEATIFTGWIYDHLLPHAQQMKNRISGLLMETGVSHNKRRLHKVGYFRELLSSNAEVNESIRPLLRVSRDSIVRLQKMDTPWSVPYSGTLCWRSESNASGPFLETDHGADLGTGNGRGFAFPLDPRSHQLL